MRRSIRKPVLTPAVPATTTTTIITATTNMATEPFPLALMAWLSPAFPVGGFAFSHGLEWAYETGDISSAQTLSGWLEDLLRSGAFRSDAILLAHAHQAATETAVSELNELALALAGSAERRLETTTQGNAFLLTIGAAWNDVSITKPAGDVAYPIAVGIVTAARGIALLPALEAFLLATISNLVSASVRMSVVGQTDGQRVIAGLLPAIRKTAEVASTATLDDLGGAAFRSDIAAICHETQSTRLFRS